MAEHAGSRTTFKSKDPFFRRTIRKILDTLANLLIRIGEKTYKYPQEERVVPWFKIDGDHTLRLDYDLSEDSIVVDVGGFRGQWSSDISAKYNCRILCFEPVQEYFENITRRFQKNPRISVFSFGLSESDAKVFISHRGDASSIFSGGEDEEIELRNATDFFAEHELESIDLMKINIEGGEYDLLEHLIRHGFVDRIVNIQVQFHDFVPDAATRMSTIQRNLSTTHELTYQYPYVWENWKLRKDRR